MKSAIRYQVNIRICCLLVFFGIFWQSSPSFVGFRKGVPIRPEKRPSCSKLAFFKVKQSAQRTHVGNVSSGRLVVCLTLSNRQIGADETHSERRGPANTGRLDYSLRSHHPIVNSYDQASATRMHSHPDRYQSPIDVVRNRKAAHNLYEKRPLRLLNLSRNYVNRKQPEQALRWSGRR